MIEVSNKVKDITPSITLAISAKARDLKRLGNTIISFGVGEPDFDTPEYIVKSAKKALDDGHTRYVASSGLPHLRKAICDKLFVERGLEYSPSQVIICNGAKHAIFNCLYATLNDGDEVIIPSPYWLTYPELVTCCGAKPVFVHTSADNSFKLTAEQLESALTPNTKMLIFNSPCNPTGAVYSKEEMLAISQVLLKHGIICLFDEIYERLVYDNHKHYSIVEVCPEMKDLTLIVNGVSKSYAMTGWRLGYLIAPEHIAKAIDGFQSHATGCINTVTQYAAYTAITQEDCSMEVMHSAFEKRRRVAVEALENYKQMGLDYVKPYGAFYIMVICSAFYGKKYFQKEINNSTELANVLLEEKMVAVTPGVCFGDDNCIRISYALPEEDIIEGLRRIAELLKMTK